MSPWRPPRPGLGTACCGCGGAAHQGPWWLRTPQRPAALGLGTGISAGLTFPAFVLSFGGQLGRAQHMPQSNGAAGATGFSLDGGPPSLPAGVSTPQAVSTHPEPRELPEAPTPGARCPGGPSARVSASSSCVVALTGFSPSFLAVNTVCFLKETHTRFQGGLLSSLVLPEDQRCCVGPAPRAQGGVSASVSGAGEAPRPRGFL